MKLLPLLLCLLMYIPVNGDTLILYFGLHKDSASSFIAQTLNDGITAHIPVLYIKRAVLTTLFISFACVIYKYRKTLLNSDDHYECLCDRCLDNLSDQI